MFSPYLLCVTICTTVYSTFKDIFNEPRFVKALEGDVHIVSDLPESLQSAPRARKHFTSWSGASYYDEVKVLWKDHKVILQFSDLKLCVRMIVFVIKLNDDFSVE